MNLIKISAVNALEKMKRGELTSEEYVNAFLEHIKARESEVGAWIFLDPELALEQARHADKKWKDKTPGILNGLPIGINAFTPVVATATCFSSRDASSFAARIRVPRPLAIITALSIKSYFQKPFMHYEEREISVDRL